MGDANPREVFNSHGARSSEDGWKFRVGDRSLVSDFEDRSLRFVEEGVLRQGLGSRVTEKRFQREGLILGDSFKTEYSFDEHAVQWVESFGSQPAEQDLGLGVVSGSSKVKG